ncbi:hypothetical protein LSAT2_017685, partial [Lamellibrachia satsuma]
MDAICATLDGQQPETGVFIECEENARGRYLVIQIDAVNSFLVLCEVEVFTAKDGPQHTTQQDARPRNTTANTQRKTAEHHCRQATPDRKTTRRYTMPDLGTPRQIQH